MDVLYREGLVEGDDLMFTEVANQDGRVVKVKLEGEVRCAAGVRLRVLKWMDARPSRLGRFEVLTVYYQYHAWRPRAGHTREQPVVRYDQAHGELHRHGFSPYGPEVSAAPISLSDVPRLDAVIREAVALARAMGSSEGEL